MRALSTVQQVIHQSANRSVHVRVRIDRSSPVTGGYSYTGNFRSTAQTLSGTVHTAGSSDATITGIGTKFTEELSVGAEVTISSTSVIVTSITDDDTMEVSSAFNIAEGSAVAITQDAGSNIVDLSNYRGHNWIKSVEMGHELDTPVGSASISLVRQIEEMSLSPLVTGSLPNQAYGVSSPVLDIINKLVIETATLGMDESPASTDWMEVFRGYIDDVDWGESEVNINCRDLGGKYQDWWMVAPPRDSSGEYTGFGNEPTASPPAPLFDIMANLLSTQNEVYATSTGAHQAKYYYNNVDYYLYTIAGDDSSLAGAGSNKETAKATTGTVEMGGGSNAVDGTGTKFTTELSIGQGVTIDAAGANLQTIVDEIISDVEMVLQDSLPGTSPTNDIASKTFTADESPQYAPKRVFDVKDKNLMEAARNMAQSIGWDFRFKWNPYVTNGQAEDSTSRGAFVPTVFCPHRDRVSSNVDFTFSPSLYYDLSSLSVSTARIKNHIKVHYMHIEYNSANEPTNNNSTYVEAENAASIAKYGRRSMILGGDEGGLGLINSGIEADRLARLALKDLQDPEIIQEVELPYFWAAEVGDYYTFEANNDHYSSDQVLSVYSIQHLIEEGKATTSLTCRGKPAGGLNSWLRTGQNSSNYNGIGAPTLAVTSDASVAAVSNYDAQGSYRVKLGDADHAKKVVAYHADARDNMLDEIFPGRKVTLTDTSLSPNLSLSGTVTSVVKDSDYMGLLGGISPIYFTIDTAFPSGSNDYQNVTVTVTGGRGILNGAGTTALLTASDPSVNTVSTGSGVAFGGTDFYMATASGDLVEAACQRDSTPFTEGGTFIGEGNRSFTVTGLVPGTTYYFACKYRVLLFRNDTESGFSWHMDSSKLSNIVTFIARGNNATIMDPNHNPSMVQYNPFGDIGSWFEHIQHSGSAATNRRAPGGWNVTTGTWGTHFLRELTYVKSGVASIKIPKNATAHSTIETDFFQAPADGLVRATSNIQVRDTRAASVFYIAVMEYDSAQNYISGKTTNLEIDGDTAITSESLNMNVWYELAKDFQLGATTKWCKFVISLGAATSAGDVYINDCFLKPVKPSFRVTHTTGSATIDTYSSGTTATIVWNDISTFPNFMRLGYDNSTGIFTVPVDGVYEFNTSFVGVTSGTTDFTGTELSILVNSTVAAITGQLLNVPDTNAVAYQLFSGPLSLKQGDAVKVTIKGVSDLDSGSANMTFSTFPQNMYFTGRQIE